VLLESFPVDNNQANNEATVTIEVEVPEGIDLNIEKSVNIAAPLVGQEITFTIKVTNLSQEGDTINTIVVRDSITAGSEDLFTYESNSSTDGSYDPITGIWTISSLEAGEENAVELQITGIVNAPGTFNNTAVLVRSAPRDGNETNNQSTVTVKIGLPTPEEVGFLFNQFSPNGDGVNDVLRINLRDSNNGTVIIQEIMYNINIFDRYGNVVYASEQEQTSSDIWDGTYKGKEAPKGTYFYILNYDIGNGPVMDKGWIQLIR